MREVLILVLSIFTFQLTGCMNSDNKKEEKEIESIIALWTQKEIFMPDSLLLYHHGEKVKTCNEDILNSGVKILSLLSNDCTSCTTKQLLFWDSFIEKNRNISELQIVLIYPGVNDYFCDVLIEDINFQYPIILDETNNILQRNRLFDNPLFTTVLLNNQNKIILMGNFANNSVLEELYISEIDAQL